MSMVITYNWNLHQVPGWDDRIKPNKITIYIYTFIILYIYIYIYIYIHSFLIKVGITLPVVP